MSKSKSIYSCTECGGQALKWQGQCPHCQAWNTLVEVVSDRVTSRFVALPEISRIENLNEVVTGEDARYSTGILEFDRVLGGGLVHGGVVLLGGDQALVNLLCCCSLFVICQSCAMFCM